jgi:hypothetical protein
VFNSPGGFGATNKNGEDCKTGFVWRLAGPDDRVCVTPQIRDAVQLDNQLAAEHRSSDPSGPWGPEGCSTGYVWRDAFAGDHVCVVPAARTQARDDNSEAALRQAGQSDLPGCVPTGM